MPSKRTVIPIALLLLLGVPALLWYLAGLSFEQGEEARRNNDCRRAVAEYSHSLTLFPLHTKAREGRADCLGQLGLQRSAIADYDRVLEARPTNAEVLHKRALAWVALDAFEQALQDCDTALDIAPHMTEAHFLRGLIRYRSGEHSQAVLDFTQALEAPPDDTTTAAYHTDRAQALWATGDIPRALDDFEAAIRLDPDNALAHAGLARLLVEAQEPSPQEGERALALARKALELDGMQPDAPLTPDRACFLDTLASALACNRLFHQAALVQLQALDMARDEYPHQGAVLRTTPCGDLTPEAMRQRLERYRRASP